MCTKSNRTCVVPTTKHVPKINIWAAFSSMGVFSPNIFTEYMNSRKIIRIQKENILMQAEMFHVWY